MPVEKSVETAIHAFVDAHREAEARFLAEIVKVPSDNPPGDCDRSAEAVATLLEGLGFSVERHKVPDALTKANGMISATNLIARLKIEGLRNRIEKEGSKLEIGASMLTRKDLNHRYESVGMQALNAGIHWLYFHPYCIDWESKHPIQADQAGVLEAIEKLKEIAPSNANIQVPVDRYSDKPLYFKKLHGAHFLIQIGADGINYAGPECKYDENSELLNLNEYLEDDFLWHPQRLKRLDELNSDNYNFIGTKHRPPMFSDYIQKLIHLRNSNSNEEQLNEPAHHFSYPCIL